MNKLKELLRDLVGTAKANGDTDSIIERIVAEFEAPKYNVCIKNAWNHDEKEADFGTFSSEEEATQFLKALDSVDNMGFRYFDIEKMEMVTNSNWNRFIKDGNDLIAIVFADDEEV